MNLDGSISGSPAAPETVQVEKHEMHAEQALQRAQIAMSYLTSYWHRYEEKPKYTLHHLPPSESEIHAARCSAETIADYVTGILQGHVAKQRG